MKAIWLIAPLLLGATTFSQEQQAVTLAATDYIDAFYFGDISKLTRSVSLAVVKYDYYRVKNKTSYEGEPMTFQEMISYALSAQKKNNRSVAEKYIKEVQLLNVQSQTTSSKVKAWWGTDYLLLAKINDRRMITHVLWQSYPNDNK